MLQSRIREIRRAKKMTLQQVADRIGTTAQTIGRLETGVRTLSINWVERIADALDADSSELLSMSGGGDVEISGLIKQNGSVASKAVGTVALRVMAHNPSALKLAETMGQYQTGDIIIFDELNPESGSSAIGNDCLVKGGNGDVHVGKLISWAAGDYACLASIAASGNLETIQEPVAVAKAVLLIRSL